MTIPSLTFEEFKSHLFNNGWVDVNNDFFIEYNRIIFSDGNISIPVKYQAELGFPLVGKWCDILGIPLPEGHEKPYRQILELRNRGKKD